MSEQRPPTFPLTAWAVHAFTATGAVWAFLALLAVLEGDVRMVFVWLGVALLVDGIDGPLARWAQVKKRVPGFDGAALDLIVDYLTYVFVPVVFVWKFDLLPQSLEIAGCAWILLTSLHLFAKTDMKADDNFFVGFPAVWNAVVLYIFLFALPPWPAAALVLVLGLLTFAPVKFVHPFRVRTARPVTIAMTMGWFAAVAGLLAALPDRPVWALILLGASTLWFAGLGLWRTARPQRRV